MINEGSERPLAGTIWYPALNSDGVEEAVTYDFGLSEVAPLLNAWYGRAIRDAAPDTEHGCGGQKVHLSVISLDHEQMLDLKGAASKMSAPL